MSAPPEYSADSSPPSYDEVSQKLQRLIQDNTNPAKVLEIASSLSDAEINVLADGFEKHYPLQDEKQKADFTVGLGQTFSSKEGQARLKQAGNAASQAVKDIEGIFTNLQLKLAQIDQVYQSGFQATLIKIQDTFTDILRESRLLAVDIEFDKIMVKFCANPNYTVDQRRARIGEFITEAKGFEDGAKGVQQRYTDLVTSFQSFVLSFSGWARDKEGELTSQIKGLEAELSDLGKQLNDIKTAQTAMTSLAGVVLPVTSLLLASKIFPGFDAVIILE
ncbi:hypothetical protein ESCO_006791 [Escovopsis weberi]|uniref:Uncharacterized protein n=1 Tax=Escovopsis weberi TaxID=150374 RepID=A0A0M8MXF6_ESCWE|nr:hypothetical protein ESCO_006791 [Escovopsis weberi]